MILVFRYLFFYSVPSFLGSRGFPFRLGRADLPRPNRRLGFSAFLWMFSMRGTPSTNKDVLVLSSEAPVSCAFISDVKSFHCIVNWAFCCVQIIHSWFYSKGPSLSLQPGNFMTSVLLSELLLFSLATCLIYVDSFPDVCAAHRRSNSCRGYRSWMEKLWEAGKSFYLGHFCVAYSSII